MPVLIWSIVDAVRYQAAACRLLVCLPGIRRLPYASRCQSPNLEGRKEVAGRRMKMEEWWKYLHPHKVSKLQTGPG
jgi:hypothetical protein